MWFNSVEFLVFMAAVLPLYYALAVLPQARGMARVLFLLIASYWFYGYWQPSWLLLLIASSVLDYVCGLLMVGRDDRQRRRVVAFSVCANLGILATFKYAKFFYVNAAATLAWTGYVPPVWNDAWGFALPPGISFYTFQTMSYVIDVYRGHARVERNLFRFALFVSFFSQLVAGPIEKAKDLLVQFRDLSAKRPLEVGLALQWIAYGLFKKLAVADSLAPIVDRVFSRPADHSGATIVVAAVFFAVQIYCDFSGYTDIAIGVARLFGIRLSLNFFYPYFTTNIRDFWRTWHISLSSWLREYLYIPLGGNRKGRARTFASLMTTMLLGGLWHGASWNFVLWGALHGVYLAVHRLWHDRYGQRATRWPAAILKGVATFTLVTLTWIPFRSESLAGTFEAFRRIFTWATNPAVALDPATMRLGWLLILILTVSDAFYRLDAGRWRGRLWPARVKAVLPALFLLLTMIFAAEETQQFIYYQF